MTLQEAFTWAGSWYLGGLTIGFFVGFCVGFVFWLRKHTTKAFDLALSV